MPEKKRQHYVPQFYLRNFSIGQEGKLLGIYVKEQDKFIPKGKLKTQACEDYFYGKNLNVEEGLSLIEQSAAPLIDKMISDEKQPRLFREKHFALIAFTLLLQARTRYQADLNNEATDKLIKQAFSKDERFKEDLDKVNFELTNAAGFSLSAASQSIPVASDLKFKLLLNKTEKQFITSDHPVVMYNQFLENRDVIGGTTGYAQKGLQIFFPLSPKHLLIFFDKGVYKVGNKKEKPFKIKNADDIQLLNMLQFLNAHKAIYFNGKVDEKTLEKLKEKSSPYQRSKKANIEEHQLKSDEPDKKKALIHFYSEDINCNLKLSFISIRRKARKYDAKENSMHLRDPEFAVIYRQFQKLVDKGHYTIGEFPKYIQDLYS